jgi:hypothetical protein
VLIEFGLFDSGDDKGDDKGDDNRCCLVSFRTKRCPPTPFNINQLHLIVALPRHGPRRCPIALANSEELVAHARIAGIDPGLIIAAPHYGLRYGSAPATGISNGLEVVRLL